MNYGGRLNKLLNMSNNFRSPSCVHVCECCVCMRASSSQAPIIFSTKVGNYKIFGCTFQFCGKHGRASLGHYSRCEKTKATKSHAYR